MLANQVAGRFEVVVTARTEEKGERIVESVKPRQLSYVVVEDIAKEGAFDHVSVCDDVDQQAAMNTHNLLPGIPIPGALPLRCSHCVTLSPECSGSCERLS